MGTNVKVLISCHKETDVVNTECFMPVQVGTSLAQKELPGMAHDNDGENISELNPMYCELTEQYWAWKNLDLDYYGFCHYRRYFNFSDRMFKEDSYGNIIEGYIDNRTIKKYAWNDQAVEALVNDYDVIITERKDISSSPWRFKNSFAHYKGAKLLHEKDYQMMLDIIDEKYPDYSKDAHDFANGSVTCFCNMYILRKDLFFSYCEWMFDILDTFCARTDMSHYSTEARRTPGHLSERLFNIYLNHLLAARPELRVKELQCVLITDTTPQEREFRPAFAKNNIPVVFAANNNFVPMFAACFRSFLDHCSEEYNYDVVLIERDITAENRAKLAAMTEGVDNVSLRFYDPGRILQHFKLKANAHISVETYFRFLIQSILPDYDKVLYLDCDTIINADVAELYNTDIEGYMLAAVRDVDFLGQINGANKKTLKYVTEEFHMQDPYNYFQAGVLLFNEKEMKKAHSVNEWLTFASTPYMYNDQDVLNLYCEGHVKYLDMAWNLITDCDHTRVKDVIIHAPDQVQKEYASAHANPKIIHYAGYMKPWHRPTEDYAEYFWSALRRTDFYEVLLFKMSEGITYWQINDHGTQTGPAHLRVLNTLMPIGSNRRKTLDDIYIKMFGR